ncbi:MAG: hypothetical protein MMC33_008966 [Icmadophila ericetorum]|nr:hypothetical protein [Icmadophila ericetorum]
MWLIARDLVLRTAQAGSQVHSESQQAPTTVLIPSWAFPAIGTTLVLFIVVTFVTSYPLDHVIPTLAIIESYTTSGTLFKASDEKIVDGDDDEDHNAPLIKAYGQGALNPLLINDERLLAHPRHITARLRTTISHLWTHAGIFSMIRGSYLALLYYLAVSAVPDMLSNRSFRNLILASVLRGTLAILFSPLNLCWTFIVIKAPSQQKRPLQQLFSHAISSFRKIFLPTLLRVAVQEATDVFSVFLLLTTGLYQYLTDPKLLLQTLRDPQQGTRFSLLCFAWSSAVLLVFYGIVIPSNVMLYRIYASLLPKRFDTIVPFDRSFGGKIASQAHDGSEVLGIRDALRTFDKASWIRVYKIYGKALAIYLAISMVYIIALAVEIGVAYHTMLEQARAVQVAQLTA